VRRTWFWGRTDSTSMTGVIRYFWRAAPRRKRPGRTTKSERYGSRWITEKSANVMYIATIISSPWARLMIRMTPMIRDIPSPIRL
jgi:hypothetical protein